MTPPCREAGRLRFCVLGQDGVGEGRSPPLAGAAEDVDPAVPSVQGRRCTKLSLDDGKLPEENPGRISLLWMKILPIEREKIRTSRHFSFKSFNSLNFFF